MDRPKYWLCSIGKLQVSRRSVVAGIATTVGAAGLSGSLPALAADDAVGSFTRVSEFLTKRTLNPVLARRYYAALKRRNPDIDTGVSQLLDLIDQTKTPDVDAFLASAQFDKKSPAMVGKIVSAWYLGVVGEGADSELVAYADALMYEPTHGILVVPSYGAGPLRWGDKPV